MGYLLNLKVKVGDRVRKGQLLASISNEELKAKEAQVKTGIEQAEIMLKNAEKDYQRIKTLFEKNSATQKELDDITTHYEAARQQVKQAEQALKEVEANLAYTSLKAPISGLITDKYLYSGDLATPGRPILSIESPNNFQAVINIPEYQILNVKKGDPVRVVIKANDVEMKGQIDEINPSAKATGGQYIAKVNLSGKTFQEFPLYSGMFVNAYIDAGEKALQEKKPDLITVAQKAIYEKGQLKGLYVATEEKKAILRWIRTGKTIGDQVEVLSGLKPEESYVLEAKSKLVNGAKLIVSK